MAFITWEDTPSDGVQTTYNIIFPFLSRDHVKVYFNGSIQPTTAYSFLSDSQISLTTAAANGVTVRIGRTTPQTVLTDFQAGVVVSEDDLDDSYLQNLYIEQELQDKYDEAVAGAITTATLTSTQHNLAATVDPTATDDTGSGYVVGSYWWNSTAFRMWMCSDATASAAVWKLVDTKHTVSTSNPTVTDDADSDYVIGSYWWNKTAGTLYFATDVTSGAAVWDQITFSLSYPLTHTGLVKGAESADIASAATTDLSTADGNYVTITGSTGPITSFGTVTAGTPMVLKFTGTPTITHHATKIQLPNDSDIVVEAGDLMFLESDGTDAWTCVHYQRASGLSLLEAWQYPAGSPYTLSSGSPTSVTLLTGLPSGINEIEIWATGVSTNTATTAPIFQLGDSGGLEATGYDCDTVSVSATGTNSQTFTDGFSALPDNQLNAAEAAKLFCTLRHMGSNVWAFYGSSQTTTVRLHSGTGDKTLSGVLDRMVITTRGGTATFDGGTLYVRYRR